MLVQAVAKADQAVVGTALEEAVAKEDHVLGSVPLEDHVDQKMV